LRDEELLWGSGTEVAEEEKIRQRWEVRDRLDRDYTQGSEPLAEEGLRAKLTTRSHPLKHVYRMRQQTRGNWEREVQARRELVFEGESSSFRSEWMRDAKWTCSPTDLDIRPLT
jgi:hypothetical protein